MLLLERNSSTVIAFKKWVFGMFPSSYKLIGKDNILYKNVSMPVIT